MQKFNTLALGYTGATISVASMLILGILGNLGIYTGAVSQMAEWHLFFSLSFAGIIGGMIEAAIMSFVIFYVFAVIYNFFVNRA